MIKRVVIGRDPRCDVVIDDEYASLRHCEVFEDRSGQVWVRDLGAINPASILPAGTPVPADHTTALLRSTQVKPGNVARLRPGDTLIVGRTRIPWTAPSADVPRKCPEDGSSERLSRSDGVSQL